jgi:hypothetical protein
MMQNSDTLRNLIQIYERVRAKRKELLHQIAKAKREGQDTAKLKDEFWSYSTKDIERLVVQELNWLPTGLNSWIRVGDVLYGVTDDYQSLVRVDLNEVCRLE